MNKQLFAFIGINEENAEILHKEMRINIYLSII